MKLKELRNEYNLSQLEAAKILGIPERTYHRYENDDNYGSLTNLSKKSPTSI